MREKHRVIVVVLKSVCVCALSIIQFFFSFNWRIKETKLWTNPVGLSNYNIPMPSSLISYVFKSNRIMCERHFLFLLFYNDNKYNIKLYHFLHLILFSLDLLFLKKVNLITIVHRGRQFNVCIVIVIVILILLYFFSYWLLWPNWCCGVESLGLCQDS